MYNLVADEANILSIDTTTIVYCQCSSRIGYLSRSSINMTETQIDRHAGRWWPEVVSPIVFDWPTRLAVSGQNFCVSAVINNLLQLVVHA